MRLTQLVQGASMKATIFTLGLALLSVVSVFRGGGLTAGSRGLHSGLPEAQSKSSSQLLDQRVTSFKIAGADMHVALQRLSATLKVPIGLEMISEKEAGNQKVAFDLDLEDCSLREVLTAIVDRDRRYQWQETDGVVNIFPVQKQQTFLDIRIGDFILSDATKQEAVMIIANSSAVQERTQKLGITLRNFVDLHGDSQVKPLSLKLHNVEVRKVLNEIIKEEAGHYWLVQIYGSRYGGDDRYFMVKL
jgi:hypothetical protein